MKTDMPALPMLQKRWDSVCKVLFGEELGAIGDYREWLLRYSEPIAHRKSSVSGSPVSFAILEYDERSKWVGFDEIDFAKKAAPLPEGIWGANDIGSLASLNCAKPRYRPKKWCWRSAILAMTGRAAGLGSLVRLSRAWRARARSRFPPLPAGTYL